MSDKGIIANFVKFKRSEHSLTQEDLADKAGVGLRFIRELEQGKPTLRMDKVNQVLSMFGQQVTFGSARGADAYDILLNYFNKPVIIQLSSRITLDGMLVKVIWENGEISAWEFVDRKDIKNYKAKSKEGLTRRIEHNQISTIKVV